MPCGYNVAARKLDIGMKSIDGRGHTVTPMTTTTAYEVAMALERADASARVLGARALAARHGSGPAAAFSALAAAGPEGLVPPVGTGGALAARHLEHAALIAATGTALPDDVSDALSHAAAAARAQAGGANALDPRGAAVAVRREVAAVRGLAADAMPRDARWHAMRLGTFLPRAGWMSALLMACTQVAASQPSSAASIWRAASLVAGAGSDVVAGESLARVLMGDSDVPISVAHAIDQVTGALFALSRSGVCDSGPLALARATGARLSAACGPHAPDPPEAEVISEVLDAIGAIAGSTRLGTARPMAREPVAA